MQVAEQIVDMSTNQPEPRDTMVYVLEFMIDGLRQQRLFYNIPPYDQSLVPRGYWIDRTNLNEYLFGGHASKAQLEAVERLMIVESERD